MNIKNKLSIPLLLKVLWGIAILVSIKSILTDTGYDNSYMIAMSYRHLSGDQMFLHMWEPHQTSLFLTDFLMWIYGLLVPSYTGVMLYLQLCGTVFTSLLSLLLYRLLLSTGEKSYASLGALLFFLCRPKQTPFYDFAAMQIAFSLLTLAFLWVYLNAKQHTKFPRLFYLYGAGFFLCLEVLSYPSGIITFIPCIYLLYRYAGRKWFSILHLTGCCGLLGLSYIGFFCIKLGPKLFFDSLLHIYQGDSHSTTAMSPSDYFGSFLLSVLWLCITLLLAYLLGAIINKIFRNTPSIFTLWGSLLLISELALLLLGKYMGIDWRCSIYIIPVFLLLLAMKKQASLSLEENLLWQAGLLFSLSSLIATALLTDLSLITIMAYAVLGGAISLPILRHYKQATLYFCMLLCALALAHRGFVIWGYGNNYQVHTILDMNNIIRNGPSAGVVGAHMNTYLTSQSKVDFDQFIVPEDKVLLVTQPLMDSCLFLLQPGQISNPSTIDTPIYNQELLAYFEINPDKYPTIIAVENWYGLPMVDSESWICTWVEEHFEYVGDGAYWKFYRQKAAP